MLTLCVLDRFGFSDLNTDLQNRRKHLDLWFPLQWSAFVCKQSCAPSSGFTYCLGDGSKDFLYVGSAKESRFKSYKGNKILLSTPGPTWRFCEHYVRLIKNLPQSANYPYSLFRRIPLKRMCWWVCNRYDLPLARKIERCMISSLTPVGNTQGKKTRDAEVLGQKIDG